ncbi:MAG: hypothetical protein NTV11_20385 [Rhodocyclales bacterium]|nr:hypothetical protein [Rhodocyclales bacterium]
MKRTIRINAIGRRIGEDHHNAKLTNHEVDQIHELLDERDRFVKRLEAAGHGRDQIRHAPKFVGLDIRSIAAKFDVAPSTVQDIHTGRRRAQHPAKSKTIDMPD